MLKSFKQETRVCSLCHVSTLWEGCNIAKGTLPDPNYDSTWDFQPPELSEMHFCCFNHAVYGTLLKQPKLTKSICEAGTSATGGSAASGKALCIWGTRGCASQLIRPCPKWWFHNCPGRQHSPSKAYDASRVVHPLTWAQGGASTSKQQNPQTNAFGPCSRPCSRWRLKEALDLLYSHSIPLEFQIRNGPISSSLSKR